MEAKIHLQKNKCDQCLFSKNRIVSKERAAEIIRGYQENDQYFICHKGSIKKLKETERGTLHSFEKASPETPDLVCAGFREAFPKVGKLLRFAEWLGLTKEVEVK